jgi:cytochrome c-type biogenesis protein CcmH/NrfG
MNQGKAAEALTAMERALALEPDNRKLQESVKQARQLLRRTQP